MRDKIHIQVIRALEKDGWTITADPFYLRLDGTTVRIDLEATKQEKVLARFILVEIKSMEAPGLYDFYAAYGQYEFYRDGIVDMNLDVPLFLAIPTKAYNYAVKLPALWRWIVKHEINLLVVNLDSEIVEQWIKH